MTEIIKLFGLAGSGKTEFIAQKFVEQVTMKGAQYSDLLAISFTRAAGQSLKERCARIYKASPYAGRHKSFEHANIRTLHSFCHEYFLKKYYGEEATDDSPRGRAMYYRVQDFQFAQMDENVERALSKLRLFSYDEEKFQQIMEDVRSASPQHQVLDIETVYNEYIEAKGKRFDYADALIFGLNSIKCDAHWKFVSIDEAQDLSRPHWEIIKKHILPNADQVLIAGDPTQSIHEWAGAEPRYFLEEAEIPCTKLIELTESHRIPERHAPVINALQRQMTDGTSHFQISTRKSGGRIDHMDWGNCLEFLWSQAQERKETLILSLNGFQLGVVGTDLIDAGILFMQDKRSDFAPWTPTVTKSDWYAYTLYYHIWNKDYDALIPYGKVWAMLESSPSLMETWTLFSDPAEKDRTAFMITVGELMQILEIERNLNEIDLVQTLFEWPPRNRRILVSGKSRKREKNMFLNKAHHRILRYIESCGEGPYTEPCIKLSTVHGAKGLESDTVVILLSQDDLRKSDDRRKLCINAISRSRERVIMTWITDEKKQDRHILKDKNLSLIMTDDEFFKHLDARWNTPMEKAG